MQVHKVFSIQRKRGIEKKYPERDKTNKNELIDETRDSCSYIAKHFFLIFVETVIPLCEKSKFVIIILQDLSEIGRKHINLKLHNLLNILHIKSSAESKS